MSIDELLKVARSKESTEEDVKKFRERCRQRENQYAKNSKPVTDEWLNTRYTLGELP